MSYPNCQKPSQKGLVQFLLDHPTGWHTYLPTKGVVELLCATANLGIVEISGTHRVFRLKCREKAERFINTH
jgi:hypothetical protein